MSHPRTSSAADGGGATVATTPRSPAASADLFSDVPKALPDPPLRPVEFTPPEPAPSSAFVRLAARTAPGSPFTAEVDQAERRKQRWLLYHGAHLLVKLGEEEDNKLQWSIMRVRLNDEHGANSSRVPVAPAALKRACLVLLVGEKPPEGRPIYRFYLTSSTHLRVHLSQDAATGSIALHTPRRPPNPDQLLSLWFRDKDTLTKWADALDDTLGWLVKAEA